METTDDFLLQRPWLPVSISGRQLLAKSWFGETSYRVLLTDMDRMWEEKMDVEDIQRRAQELNRRLRAPVGSFFSHLCDVVRPHLSGSAGPEHLDAHMTLHRHDDDDGGGVILRLKSELSGLPFYWEFHCTPTPGDLVCVQLVRPLLVMSRLLQKQVDQLGGLLVRKDAEIQDYRENGATLSRERLQTDAFEEPKYREEFMAKTLPLLISERRDDLGFDVDLQQLYAAVAVAHGNAGKRKRPEEEEEEEEEEESKTSGSVQQPPASGSAEPSDRKLNRNGGKETSGAKMADRPAVQQPSVTSDSAQRPTSKPKKKKVGLFR